MPVPLEQVVEWDIANWSKALEFWHTHSNKSLTECTALELGSRHGGLSLWLAEQGARVICSDIGLPSEQAYAKHKRFGVSDHIEYADIDATAIPFNNQFDIVVFKSALGGIGHNGNNANQALALQQMYQALKPGGELWFAENLQASPLHGFLRRRLVDWAGHWNYLSITRMEEYLTPFAQLDYHCVGFLGAFGRSEAQRRALAAIDTHLCDKVLPASWRYIMFGVARK